MNYLISDTNTLVWFCFTVYAITAIFLLPNAIDLKFESADASYQTALQFASRFVLRIALLFPMVFFLKNSI